MSRLLPVLVLLCALLCAFPASVLLSELLGTSEFLTWIAACLLAVAAVARRRTALRSPTVAAGAALGLLGVAALLAFAVLAVVI